MKKTALLVLIVVAGCGSREDVPGTPAPNVICTMEARSAITIEIVDRQNGQTPRGVSTLTVRDGSYTDTATIDGSMANAANSLGVAYERAGTYRVTVSNPNYETWERSNVQVTRDECHVQTVRLRAELEPRQ
jgi:hypothetical protein